MINYDDFTKENINNHNLNCPQILNQSCKILIIGSSESGTTNALLNQ